MKREPKRIEKGTTIKWRNINRLIEAPIERETRQDVSRQCGRIFSLCMTISNISFYTLRQYVLFRPRHEAEAIRNRRSVRERFRRKIGRNSLEGMFLCDISYKKMHLSVERASHLIGIAVRRFQRMKSSTTNEKRTNTMECIQ